MCKNEFVVRRLDKGHVRADFTLKPGAFKDKRGPLSVDRSFRATIEKICKFEKKIYKFFYSKKRNGHKELYGIAKCDKELLSGSYRLCYKPNIINFRHSLLGKKEDFNACLDALDCDDLCKKFSFVSVD